MKKNFRKIQLESLAKEIDINTTPIEISIEGEENTGINN